jgi:hypothetical protein
MFATDAQGCTQQARYRPIEVIGHFLGAMGLSVHEDVMCDDLMFVTYSSGVRASAGSTVGTSS